MEKSKCKYIGDCENKCLTHCLDKTLEKNKELTPMQELIEYLENNSLIDKKVLINKCKKLLPKEKQVIEDAFDNGVIHGDSNKSGENYYKTKYNIYE